MNAEALVLAVLDALPRRQVHGKKRLQKLSFFAVQTGTDSNAKFFLHDFGPFSADVAAATELLSLFGDVSEEDVQLGRAKRYFKLYRLANETSVPEALPGPARRAISTLNEYSTIELEVASTICYFISRGLSPDEAKRRTVELKPSKSEPKILKSATEALSRVGLYEGRRADQMSGP